MRQKVLLLNPPGRQVYLRDYYCSKVSKSNYVTHPVDLLVLSGRLAERFEVHVLDAITDGISEAECIAGIEKLAPDAIIALVGAISYDEDRALLAKLKKPSRLIVVTGDSILDEWDRWFQLHPFVDAAILDFTAEDIVHYLDGRPGHRPGIVVRDERSHAERHARPLNEEFILPVPRHDLFASTRYRYPFLKHREFATVLTDYGCPYKCSFCTMSTIGYKFRPVENIMEELRFLRKLGRKDIYFCDQTFGINRERTLALCESMLQEGLQFGWSCFSRVDLLTEEMLAAMQQAGCHTVKLGVETASNELLRKYRKGFTTEQVRAAFRLCKAKKIRTVGTFILGLPGETEESASATISFARELGCDFASFNIAVPRMGTLLRREAVRDGIITRDLVTMDQSGSSIAMATRELSREQLGKLRNRAIRDFYLRPSYLWHRAKSLSTFHEMREHFSEARALLAGL